MSAPRMTARRIATRPFVAGALLLAVYVVLSLALDSGGFLGTDTGTKVYTLEVMEREGRFSPDIGYWAAEHDPNASLHPVHQTSRESDGSYVGVTTLPMLAAARPLYELGGYRAALLLPMLGGVACAVAARHLARRLDPPRDGWLAFWAIGLGSPVVVYALDLWEHTLGLACILWALVALLGVLDERPWWTAAAAGLLFGAGSTLRQEVLVYGLVITAAACGLLVLRRRPVQGILAGAAVVAGFALPWLLNGVLESSVQGQSRASRSTGAATSAVSDASPSEFADRVEEGAQTFVGLVAGDPAVSVLLGLAVVAAVVVAARAEGRGDRTFAAVGLVAAGAVYAADAIGGLGFVPGLLTALPLALGGLLAWSQGGRVSRVVAMAVVALPIVYAFQYLGGAPPQWGGRYTLASGSMLAVAALVGLANHRPFVLRGLLVLSFGVAALGVAWLVERTHGSDRFFDRLVEEAEPVVIARQAFLLREGGATTVDRRWFSVGNEAEFIRAVDIVREIGDERFTVLEWEGEAPPEGAVPDDVREVRRAPLEFVNTDVGLVTYEFTG